MMLWKRRSFTSRTTRFLTPVVAPLLTKAEVEMEASIMTGKDQRSGAVTLVKNVKNPVSLARAIMEKTAYIYLGDRGAMDFANKINVPMMPEAYFITDHAFEEYRDALKEAGNTLEQAGHFQVKRKEHGTVGAVAVDKKGQVAAATSTGGLANKIPGRIGDSSMIGVGCYANPQTCAVSGTGDGEFLIRHVVGFHLHSLMLYKEMPLKKSAHYLFRTVLKEVDGDIGLVAVDPQGNIALEFNSPRMHRGYQSGGEVFVAIYPGDQ